MRWVLYNLVVWWIKTIVCNSWSWFSKGHSKDSETIYSARGLSLIRLTFTHCLLKLKIPRIFDYVFSFGVSNGSYTRSPTLYPRSSYKLLSCHTCILRVLSFQQIPQIVRDLKKKKNWLKHVSVVMTFRTSSSRLDTVYDTICDL